jgi:hypothetical protein
MKVWGAEQGLGRSYYEPSTTSSSTPTEEPHFPIYKSAYTLLE